MRGRWPLAVLVFAQLFSAFPSLGDEAGDNKLEPDAPAADKVELPGITIDAKHKRVDIDAKVALDNGLLELIACIPDSKEHESLVVIDAAPVHLHAALLLIGANNGHPAMVKPANKERTEWLHLPPRGDAIAVSLVYPDLEGKDKVIERPISDFLKRAERIDGGVPEDAEDLDEPAEVFEAFLFAGSVVVKDEEGKQEYLADINGNVVSISTFGDEVLCLPTRVSQNNSELVWSVNDKHLPKVGTKVKLRLALKQAQDQPGEDAGAKSQPIKLGTPFVDGAVFQRCMPVPVWGWAEPGAEVAVSFAGQTKPAKAGEDGKWLVRLDPLTASSKPQSMTVAGGDSSLSTAKTVDDILVGEVWVASGQSNMQWLSSKCDVGRILQKGIRERVDVGEEPEPIIREAKVTDVFSALHPIEHAQGEWINDGAKMSGIAYAFAYELWKELQVPIGIVNCSFSSTTIEAWTPREGFANSRHPFTKAIYQELLQSDPSTPEHEAAWEAYYSCIEAAIEANDRRIKNGQPALPVELDTPGNLQGNRDASWLYNARMHPMVPYAVRGAIWNQGYANSGAGLSYYPNLHSLVRGWRLMWQRPDLPVYFHQFYSAGKEGGTPTGVSFNPTSEMRLGTAMARDIPNTGMASQIDIGGAIHYDRKALPGQRLSLHALKNQYGKEIAVDGPFFQSYEVKGNKLILSFDHAEGGLFVGEVEADNNKPAVIVPVPEGERRVGLFYLADDNRVWHQARCKIVGEQIELTSPGVAEPRGVSYGSPGIGFQPNIYNSASLPLTPFVYYDNKVVTKATWPDDPPKIAGIVPDPSEGGLVYEYRKMPLLSTQFRDNAVLQHGKPVTIWGSAIHNWGAEYHAEMVGDHQTEIRFSFGGFKETVVLTPGMDEWSVTLDPMQPTVEPRTLRAAFYIDGELIHERVAENIVVGDVWFVAAPAGAVRLPEVAVDDGVVRVMQRKAKRDRFTRPSPYSIAVSTTPKNRFASEWLDIDREGLAGAIAHRIAAKVDHPVGVVFMQSTGNNPPLKSWMPFAALANAPSLADDYEELGAGYPGSPSYNANLRRYVNDWQTYWSGYIPEMIETRRVPDGSAWGTYPSQASKSSGSEATQSYNVMVHSFRHAAVKGVVFVGTPEMSRETLFFDGPLLEGMAFANSWRDHFGYDGLQKTPLLSMLMPVAMREGVLLPAPYLDDATNMQPYAFTPGGDEAPFVFDTAFLEVFDRAINQTYR
ncbi:MAG: YdjY domain-containing protein [Planctomycetota bacterium]